MRTEDLIRHLAQEPARPSFDGARLAVLLLAVLVSVCALFLLLAGVRPDLGRALQEPILWAKPLLPAALCLIALRAAVLSARPGQPLGAWPRALVVPAAAAALLWLRAFALLPPDQRFAEVGPLSLSECLGLIPLLALVPAAVLVALLRQGAPVRPRLTGLLAGLAAGAGSATGYSLFCTRDNPLFFVTWYGLAILVVAAGTALAAPRFLRW